MSRQGRPPKINVDSLLRVYVENDLSSGELEERFGINRGTIYYHLKRAGIWHGKSRNMSATAFQGGKVASVGSVSGQVAAILQKANKLVEGIDGQPIGQNFL